MVLGIKETATLNNLVTITSTVSDYSANVMLNQTVDFGFHRIWFPRISHLTHINELWIMFGGQ